MYFPILRGKQFELIALRELAKLVDSSVFNPVIEPIKEFTKPLSRTIKELNDSSIKPIVIINSELGNAEGFTRLYEDLKQSEVDFLPCVSFSTSHSDDLIQEALELLEGKPFSLYLRHLEEERILHFIDKPDLILIESSAEAAESLSKATEKKVVVIEDGFVKRNKNADYPPRSKFQSLFSDYKKYELYGFGDYTITGSMFSEGGGPAYVVAIHLSQILKTSGSIFSSKENLIVNHFRSDDNGTYDDPAGKFLEALTELNEFLDKNNDITQTSAINSFRKLYEQKHFPGLGAVKKLSISHHIELITSYLKGS